MELIVVTPPDYFEGEAALLNQFFAEGLPLLHIRKPGMDAGRFRKLMQGIHPEYYPRIAIHQHHDFAEEFSLRRLHFTEQQRKAMSDNDMGALSAGGYHLSTSIHELQEIPPLWATNELSRFDYVFFGPVFNSISKAGYKSVLVEGFILPAHDIRVFGIGGVSTDQLGRLKQMNFDGAAVLGSLWHQAASPLEALKILLKTIHQMR